MQAWIGVQRALDVDVHDAIPERVVDRGELGARVDARVGRQDVDAAVRGERGGGQRLDRGAVGDVGRHGEGPPPPRELGGALLGGRPVDVGDDDARALGGEHRGDAAPDAAGGTGDDGDLIGEWLHDRARL